VPPAGPDFMGMVPGCTARSHTTPGLAHRSRCMQAWLEHMAWGCCVLLLWRADTLVAAVFLGLWERLASSGCWRRTARSMIGELRTASVKLPTVECVGGAVCWASSSQRSKCCSSARMFSQHAGAPLVEGMQAPHMLLIWSVVLGNAPAVRPMCGPMAESTVGS
jgi:hypothetical protein